MTLEYWNSLANQLILISALLSGFSIAVMANLIVSDRNDTLCRRLLKISTTSAGCFLVAVFAMTKISMMTTPGGLLKNVLESDFLLPRIIGLSAFMVGLVALAILISLSGWTKSRKAGIFSTLVGIVTLLLILITMTDITL
ncbi:MAG: hypothetical protein N4A74_09885 [Carboxylicivirga sp.]|jgi:hypothetical protein|nr:hypothetical protein [Carboxylicivirga sp.]